MATNTLSADTLVISEMYRALRVQCEAAPEFWCWGAEAEADEAGFAAESGDRANAIACIARARGMLDRAETLLLTDRFTGSFNGPDVVRIYYGPRAGYLRWLDRNRHLFARLDLVFEAGPIDDGRDRA